jgi:hypothetical protein
MQSATRLIMEHICPSNEPRRDFSIDRDNAVYRRNQRAYASATVRIKRNQIIKEQAERLRSLQEALIRIRAEQAA